MSLLDLRTAVEGGTATPDDWDAALAEYDALSARPTAEALQALQDAHQTAQADAQTARQQLADLEAAQTATIARAADLESALTQRTAHADQLQAGHAEALAMLRDAWAVQHSIPVQLLTGTNVAELTASLETGKAVVAQIAEQIRTQAAAIVPNGNPGRTGPDWSALTPIDKIRQGLANGSRR